LQQRLLREFARLQALDRQIRELHQAERQSLRDDRLDGVEKARVLFSARGVGAQSAWLLVREVFGWRQIRNRRELAALAGLVSTPYASGQSNYEQGISKAGNKRIRWLMVQLAWSWTNGQPDSKLSKWYAARFGGGGKRQRKIGIVALARKLLIALWRLAEFGEVPDGAVMNDWEAKLAAG
jgi:transposase